MASEPFFEERSDAVKMSETPYPTNGSGKNPVKDTVFKYSNLCTSLPLSPRKARHFPPHPGKQTTKAEKIYKFHTKNIREKNKKGEKYGIIHT